MNEAISGRTVDLPDVESEDMGDFVRAIRAGLPLARRAEEERADVEERPKKKKRIDVDPEQVKNGLGQLVLTLVRLLHELLEKQAIRRIDAGSLDDGEIERIGIALMQQTQEIERLRKEFGLEEEDLNLDLGPLGKLL